MSTFSRPSARDSRMIHNFDTSSVGTLIVSFQSVTGIASISDGTTNTLLVGEKHVRPNSRDGKNEDRSIFSGCNANNYSRLAGLDPNSNVQRTLVQNERDQTGATNERFGGPHPGICMFVFCDGSVKGVKTSVDLTTLTRLAVRDDGLVIGSNDY